MVKTQERSKQERKKVLQRRCYAFYIDLTFIAILQKLIVVTYINCVRELLTTIPFSVKASLLERTYQLTFPTLAFTFFSYFLVSYFFNNGVTIGKAIFNLRVCSNHNIETELTFRQCLVRAVTYTFCYLAGGFLLGLPFLRKDVRGIPDYLSASQVLTEDEKQNALKLSQQEQLEKGKEQLELFIA